MRWLGARLAAGVALSAATGFVFYAFIALAEDVGNKIVAIAWGGLFSAVAAGLIGGPIACVVLCSILPRAAPWRVWWILALGAVGGLLVTMHLPLSAEGGIGWIVLGGTAGGALAAVLLRRFSIVGTTD